MIVKWRHLRDQKNITKCVKCIQPYKHKHRKVVRFGNYQTSEKRFPERSVENFPTGFSRHFAVATATGGDNWLRASPYPRHTFSTVCQIGVRISRTKPRRPRQSRLFSLPTWKEKCNTVVQILSDCDIDSVIFLTGAAQRKLSFPILIYGKKMGEILVAKIKRYTSEKVNLWSIFAK